MEEIFDLLPWRWPFSAPPPPAHLHARSFKAGDLQQDGKGVSLLSTSHLRSL